MKYHFIWIIFLENSSLLTPLFHLQFTPLQFLWYIHAGNAFRHKQDILEKKLDVKRIINKADIPFLFLRPWSPEINQNNINVLVLVQIKIVWNIILFESLFPKIAPYRPPFFSTVCAPALFKVHPGQNTIRDILDLL